MSNSDIVHDTESLIVWGKSGKWWYEAPLPPRWHRCKPWNKAMDMEKNYRTWRCACGNIGWPDLGWGNEKNSRRRRRAPQ
jgi:hypothetical protein